MAAPTYELALERFDEARERIRRHRQSTTAATSFQITEEEIIQETQFPSLRWRWPWLLRRALRWDRKQQRKMRRSA